MNFEQVAAWSGLFGAVCVLIIIGLIRISGTSYLKKKGENLATKEDIKGITYQMESIKAKFDLSNEFQKAYEKDKNNELLSFYDKITQFRYEYLSVNIGNFPMDGGQSLYEYQQNFHLSVVEIIKQYQRLVVYLAANSDILAIAEGLTEIALKTDKVMRSKFPIVKKSSIKESIAYAEAKSTGDNIAFHQAANDTDKANEEFLSSMRPLLTDFVAGYSNYLTGLNHQITINKPNKSFNSEA